MTTQHTARAILLGCLLSGTLDILTAFAMSAARDVPPSIVLQAIASGVLGKSAFHGGMGTAALGLMLHFAIMLGLVTAYWYAVCHVPVAARSPVLTGIAFGAGMYILMNVVVLPLSNIAFVPKYSPATVLRDLAIHIVMVGLPMALTLRAMLGRRGQLST